MLKVKVTISIRNYLDYRLHAQILMFIFHRLGGLSKESVQVRGSLIRFVTINEELLTPTPNIQTGGPLIVFCPLLLIQYIRSHSL
jgi:hypothetical protein